MVELLDTLAQFLCREQASRCLSAVQQQSPDALVQLTFLAFFPAVFLILLVYFLSELIIGRENHHRGLRVLLGVAFFLFVIFYNWYHFLVSFSEFWYVFVLVLGGTGVIVHRLAGYRPGQAFKLAGEGGGRGGLFGGVAKYGMERLKKGGKPLGIEKKIEGELKVLRGMLNEVRHPRRQTDVGLLRSHLNADLRGIIKDIEDFEAEYGRLAEETLTKKWWREINDIQNELGKIDTKYKKAA